MPPEQIREVYRAYLFGAEAHEGQHRLSGEPYIYHPIAVARILAGLHMDAPTIIAALLHDVIEDTEIPKEIILREFGGQVAELVDGVSKLTQFDAESTQADIQAANFRKMLMAMTRDIRVILIKLADRLHNMRTLGVKKSASRRRIARETLEIYAPIASRLGISDICKKLEELGFAALYPLRHRVITQRIKDQRGNRIKILDKIESSLCDRLADKGIQAKVLGREKHSYSIYRKMQGKKLDFDNVKDLYGYRIIVDKVDTCYRVLGLVHALYKPKPGSFKDYIAIPKMNGYQSLHTSLVGPLGLSLEVQIRTHDMHAYSEFGIATHGLYKAGEDTSSARRRAGEWLRNLLEIQQNAGSSREFLDTVKIDLFPDEIYVFSPKGKIFELPRGATPVDFAYAIHSDIGDKAISAKIDGMLVASMDVALKTGQSVEIITAAWSRPRLRWLDFVVSAKARSRIRAYFKSLSHDEAKDIGKRMLDRELTRYDNATGVDKLTPEQQAILLETFSCESMSDLLISIGLGNHMAFLVARRLMLSEHTDPDKVESMRTAGSHGDSMFIRGAQGMVVHLARCCRPVPGDSIKGYVSSGHGIVVHTHNCKNTATSRDRAANWIDLAWEEHVDNEVFPVDIRVEVKNKRGVLATISTAIADLGVNIEDVATEHSDDMITILRFCISVQSRFHLASIVRHLRRLNMVKRIQRTR